MYVPDVIPEDDAQTMVQKGGYGKQFGFGDEVALLVVDMTREFVEDRFPNGYAETGKPATEAIRELRDVTTEKGIRSYFSRPLKGTHDLERGQWRNKAEELGFDEEMLEIVPELSPADDDIVFGKYKPSAFFGTQLESLLNQDGADTLVITGMTTSGCVRASIIDAFSYNYRVIVPEECTADRSQISHETTLFDVDMKYGDVRPLDEVIAVLESDF